MLSVAEKKRIRNFRRYLFIWGRTHWRDFPWRKKPTPYNVLISEFFLQRTKAPQAEKQYRLFVKQYPNFFSLYNISTRELKKYFGSLGLRKRTRIFRKLIKIINEKFNGRVPTEYDTLIKLPGIGDYTASAIEVFAFNRKKALIDANTIRIFSRLLGREISREEGKRSKLVKECALYFSSLGKNTKKANWLLIDYGFAALRRNDKLKFFSRFPAGGQKGKGF